MGGLWWLWRWRRPLSGRGLRRWLLAWVVLLLWLGSMTAQAASNALPSPAGRLDDRVLPVDINQFKPPECAGITVSNLFVASASDGIVSGTAGNDLILGTAGVDWLNGQGGDDCIVGGAGDDGLILFPIIIPLLNGGAGDDVILGGPGNDIIEGANGNDALYGQGGNDILFGSAGADYLNGGNGADYCDGGTGANTVVNCP